MKTVICTIPMTQPEEILPTVYPVNGNKPLEYGKPVRCPVNAVLAKTLKKGEELRVIYIMTAGKNSRCEDNKKAFIEELEAVNSEIGAVIKPVETVEMEFTASKRTYNKLITDLAGKIPENAEIYVDITYGFKPEILSLFCALRFVEEFHNAILEYFIYGKAEIKKIEGKKIIENPEILDITSLYYLFKLIGSIGTADADTASNILEDFFAL